MVLKTVNQYLESLRELSPVVYVAGEKVDVLTHPNLKPVVNAVAKTYELAQNPKYEAIMTAKSHLTGEKINRFNHIPRNIEDLERRVDLAILTSQKIGSCNYRCAGCDALSALESITYEMDKELGTNYHQRLINYLKYVQQNDLACSGALTDPKGDRKLRPKEQEDPDMYLHVVEKGDDGIVVRGAKVNQSGSAAAHENIVVPGMTFREGEEEYAVAFAVPSNAKGLIHIMQETPEDAERRLVEDENELGIPKYGVRETFIMVFDDVFIPWDRVFMCGEVKYTRELVLRFASNHRTSSAGCKVGFAEGLIGATYAIADYNGLAKAPNIRTELAQMIYTQELARACALAAALKGWKAESGTYFPNYVLANVAKLASAYGFIELMKNAIDISGGLTVTLPALSNLKSPVGEYLKKYLKGRSGVPAEHRIKMFKFLQTWVAGPHAPGAWHGGGSPMAQLLTLYALTDLESKKRQAMELAGIEEETE